VKMSRAVRWIEVKTSANGTGAFHSKPGGIRSPCRCISMETMVTPHADARCTT